MEVVVDVVKMLQQIHLQQQQPAQPINKQTNKQTTF